METSRILVPLPVGLDSTLGLERLGWRPTNGDARVQTWKVGEASLLVATDAWLPRLARDLSRTVGGFVLALDARRRVGEEHVTSYFAGFCIEQMTSLDLFEDFSRIAERLMGTGDGLLVPPEGTPVQGWLLDASAEQLGVTSPILARVALTSDAPMPLQGWRHTVRPATAWSTAFGMAERAGPLDVAAIQRLVRQLECTAVSVELAGDGPDFRWSWCDPDHPIEVAPGRGATAFIDIWEEFTALVGERPAAVAWPPELV